MKITEALVAEHRIFLNLFDQVEQALPTVDTVAGVRTLAHIVQRLLERHAATETNLAYLALDHLLENKGELDRLYADHQEIDGHLSRIAAAANGVDAQRALKTALLASRQHFRHEERFIFPLLERLLQPESLNDLGRAWLQQSAASASSQPAI